MYRCCLEINLSFFLSVLPGNPPGLEGHDPVVEHMQEGEVTAVAIGLIFQLKIRGLTLYTTLYNHKEK
jgi:hypothetical protein